MSKKTKKIGELLVEAGLANRLEVDHALQAQQIFGDRLGTNLIEMGVIDGDTLAGFLSEQYGVPRATRAEMDNVPNEVLQLIPARAAQRLCLLPIQKSGGLLVIAMMDPSDERVVERISKNLELKLSCKVATEIEIRFYLEKYYNIPREARHILLMKQARNEKGLFERAPEVVKILSAQLDRHLSSNEAIEMFFEQIKSLDKIPVRKNVKDLTTYDLTPELTYLLFQIDGISSLRDLLTVSTFPRISTLRAMVYFLKIQLIQFEEP